ncbi:hypothetical protein TTHERM_00439320 (macronuclear) [Tetrahymena thermophila SB210]|uniref:hypothetical protein n=1 Tax=Tetrahymena thermophila (strain SB210) TaxID=312017 RepID=UPI00006CCBE8|nr:hypothetical protein TTHERM_00439320 [Tetrahymena thermophila SB210]EAR97584.3 hypothetical protein TTHERM_00439320 [Tetrahymena thermophila SB210]|eukprot:XP_001017829.3 hypothetical protein TTHERM_00439320 [Tetrahymena thermophila SB210]
MDAEQEQVMYPRILFEQMAQFRGKKVTVVGNVCNEDQNDSLVIEFGPTGLNQHVVIDNYRRVDLNNTTKFVEIRGVVLNQNIVSCEELTEFEQKDPFGKQLLHLP